MWVRLGCSAIWLLYGESLAILGSFTLISLKNIKVTYISPIYALNCVEDLRQAVNNNVWYMFHFGTPLYRVVWLKTDHFHTHISGP